MKSAACNDWFNCSAVGYVPPWSTGIRFFISSPLAHPRAPPGDGILVDHTSIAADARAPGKLTRVGCSGGMTETSRPGQPRLALSF
jgi:hypothetical protein